MTYKVGRCLLRERLNDVGMTQQQLANIMDIRVQQINKYVLNKQKMSFSVAKNIAFILNCQMEDLYDYEWIEAGNNE